MFFVGNAYASLTCRCSKSCNLYGRNFPCRTGAFTRFRLFVPCGQGIVSFRRALSPCKRDTEWHNEQFTDQPRLCYRKHRSLQHYPCFRVMINLQPRIRRSRCSSARATGTPVAPNADSKRNTLLSALFWPFRELLCLPFHKNLPLPARFWSSGDFLSHTTLARSLLRETSVQTFLRWLQHGLTFWRPLSQPSHFL